MGEVVKDIVKDILFLFASMAIGFLWMLLVLLIISFVSLGYIHMHLDRMIIVSVIFAVAVGVYKLVKMVKKYRK